MLFSSGLRPAASWHCTDGSPSGDARTPHRLPRLATRTLAGQPGSAFLRAPYRKWTRIVETIMERFFSLFERILKIQPSGRSTLVLLKWGFGEYYQCGYWAALENRGSRLFAAARGSNPLLSASRDPRDFKTSLTGECSLTSCSPSATFKLVLKRGTVSIFRGGLTSRLLLLSHIPPRIAYHA